MHEQPHSYCFGSSLQVLMTSTVSGSKNSESDTIWNQAAVWREDILVPNIER